MTARVGRHADAAAHDGTPPACFAFPDPSDCTAEPQSADDVRALIADTAATPDADASPEARPTPTGPPTEEAADDQTAADINAAWREDVACTNGTVGSRAAAAMMRWWVRHGASVPINAHGHGVPTTHRNAPVQTTGAFRA